jgi:hypothetical protein
MLNSKFIKKIIFCFLEFSRNTSVPQSKFWEMLRYIIRFEIN